MPRGVKSPESAARAEQRRLRRQAARMTFDELLEAGLCECGVWLAEHPKLPKPDTRTWMAKRDSPSIWARNRHEPTEAQLAYRQSRKGKRPDAVVQPVVLPRRIA